MEHTKIYYLHRGNGIPFYIGKSKNSYDRLQNHKQTYGPSVEMVIISEVKNWKRWEQYYIKKYKDLGYNLENKNKGGGGVDFVSEETKQKISNHPTRGKLIAIANTGMTKIHKGRPFTEDHKNKIRETRDFLKSRPNTWQKIPVIQCDLEENPMREFGSQTEAQYIMGKPNSDGVGACCRGHQKTAYGYKWKYKQ